jgi:hypothetical protein
MFLLFKNSSFLIQNFLLAFEMGKTCSVEGSSLKIAKFHSKKRKKKITQTDISLLNWKTIFEVLKIEMCFCIRND